MLEIHYSKERNYMIDIKNRWALVTGASRGIGYLTALFLADRGCNLVLHSRDRAHTEKVLAEVKAKGVEAFAVSAELDNLTEVERMLGEIDALGVNIEFIANNAGVQIAYRSDYLTTLREDYEISFRINTIAPMMICYHFLPQMIANGFGRILNTTSGIALDPQQAGYSASKAALDKVTIDIGSKLQGTDVCINLTDPGWCRTDLGGPQAPNDPKSALPGIVVGLFIDDKKSGRYLGAQNFAGMTLEDAVAKAEREFKSPY